MTAVDSSMSKVNLQIRLRKSGNIVIKVLIIS